MSSIISTGYLLVDYSIILGLIAIGIGAVLAPLQSSKIYGIQAQAGSSQQFVKAMGARDIALGIVGFSIRSTLLETTWLIFVIAVACFSAVDGWLVYRAGDRGRWHLHLAAGALLAAYAAVIWLLR